MFRKYLVRVGILAAVVLSLSAVASAQKVRYNFLPGTNFGQFKTYKWVDISGAQYPNQLIDGQIRQAIDRQLATKGLQKTEDAGADLYIAYQAAVNKEQQWNSYSTGGDMWGWGGWGGWGGMSTTTTTSSTINIGTLNLDFYDASNKKQVWRGEATKTLGNPKTPEKLQRNIDKAMEKLLKNYPPPPPK